MCELATARDMQMHRSGADWGSRKAYAMIAKEEETKGSKKKSPGYGRSMDYINKNFVAAE